MEPHSEILQELQLLNSPLATMPRALDISVPDGYFQNSAARFVTGVLAQDAPDILLSIAPSKVPAFKLPAGYFETAASVFVAGVLAQDAPEIALSVLSSKVPAGELPNGYFNHSASVFVAGVLAQDAPDISLSVLPSKVPAGEIPASFFEQFPAQVLQLAKAHDFVESLPPSVAVAPPAPYFEELPAQVLRRVLAEDRAANMPTGKSRKTIVLPVFRWVAAAALIAGVSFGMYRAGQPNAGPHAVNRALAAVPQSELQAYVTQNLDDFDIEMLEKNADVSQLKVEAPHLQRQDIELYLQAEQLL